METENRTKKLLRHLVLFKFYNNTDETIIDEISNKFGSLKHQIELVRDFEYGINVSKEGLSNGFTHCFMLSFDNENDRDDYIVHEAHQAFVKFINGYVESVCVIDYWN